jgi:hypothetical protein
MLRFGRGRRAARGEGGRVRGEERRRGILVEPGTGVVKPLMLNAGELEMLNLRSRSRAMADFAGIFRPIRVNYKP